MRARGNTATAATGAGDTIIVSNKPHLRPQAPAASTQRLAQLAGPRAIAAYIAEGAPPPIAGLLALADASHAAQAEAARILLGDDFTGDGHAAITAILDAACDEATCARCQAGDHCRRWAEDGCFCRHCEPQRETAT
jgi:hypothetical protein